MESILKFTENLPIFNNPIWDFTYWNNSLKSYLIAFILFLILIFVFYAIKKIVLKTLLQFSQNTNNKVDDIILESLDKTHWGFLAFLSIFSAVHLLNISENLNNFLNGALITILVVQGIIIINIAFKKSIKYYLKKENADEYSFIASGLIQTLVSISLWVFGILFVLSNFGINVVSLVAGLGIGGIAIALALQNILEDLFSSFAIFFDKPFAIGDFIVVGENMGTVKKIGIKTTRLKSLQGEEVVITNKELTGARIQNYKKMVERRILFQFGVLYNTPDSKLQAIPDLIRDIVEEVNLARFSRCHFLKFGDSALIYEVVYHVESGSYESYMNVNQEIHFKINETFKKKGIEIAYPTQTVYLHQVT